MRDDKEKEKEEQKKKNLNRHSPPIMIPANDDYSSPRRYHSFI